VYAGIIFLKGDENVRGIPVILYSVPEAGYAVQVFGYSSLISS
jgi:hypothetical protein